MKASERILEYKPWRVRCCRHGDRHQQIVERWQLGEWLPILISAEGDGDQDWPPSPPLQQLVLDELHDSLPVLLGVGMAGSAHWSLSLHVDPATQYLIFDNACRSDNYPDALGSSFQLGKGISAILADDAKCIQFSNCDGTICQLETNESCQLHVETDSIRIEPILSMNTPSPRAGAKGVTYRWKFTLSDAQ